MTNMATKTKEPSKEVATTTTTATIVDDTGEMVPLTREAIVAWLDGESITEEDEADFDVYALAMKILGAEDEAAALAKDDVRKHAELHDKTFTVLSVIWRKSTKRDDGKGRYAISHCVDVDGSPFIWSCGATKVLLQLRKAQVEGWMPWQVTLNAETTASGNTVLELVAPSPDF